MARAEAETSNEACYQDHDFVQIDDAGLAGFNLRQSGELKPQPVRVYCTQCGKVLTL